MVKVIWLNIASYLVRQLILFVFYWYGASSEN